MVVRTILRQVIAPIQLLLTYTRSEKALTSCQLIHLGLQGGVQAQLLCSFDLLNQPLFGRFKSCKEQQSCSAFHPVYLAKEQARYPTIRGKGFSGCSAQFSTRNYGGHLQRSQKLTMIIQHTGGLRNSSADGSPLKKYEECSKPVNSLGCTSRDSRTSETSPVIGKTTEQNCMLKMQRFMSEVFSLSTLKS